MSWNYRVIKKDYGYTTSEATDTETRYRIHEVYYDDKGKPNGCTAEPITLSEGSLDELRDTVIRILKAIDEKPILDYDEDFK